ncbi:MAG: MFS transporter [Actinomycetota bacterium]
MQDPIPAPRSDASQVDASAESTFDAARPSSPVDEFGHDEFGDVVHDDIGQIEVVAADTAVEAPLENSATAGLWALFLGLLLLMLGNGLNGTVVGLRSESQGFDVVVTGVIMAGYFAGFLLSPSAVVRMVPSVGHIRVFAGLASTASSAVLVHSVTSDPVSWTLMRFVFGFCAAGLYVVIESWLNDSAGPAIRGRMLSIYMIVSMLGLGAGQLLVGIGDIDGYALFVVASVLVSLSLVPVTLAATTTPPPVRAVERSSVRDLWSIAATGVLGALMSGVVVGALFGLAAVYAARSGVSVERTGVFVSMPMIGAVLCQYPIGWVSDRVPRRGVILVVGATLVAACAGQAVVDADSLAALALMLVIGGTVFPLYSLSLTYTLDWTPTGTTVAVSGTLVRLNGTGAFAGPLIASLLMSVFDERWLFWTSAIAAAVLTAVTGVRIITRDGVPVDRQRRFVNLPGRASEYVLRLQPRRRR